MDNYFKDKTVIITGGSEGVGAATARKFAETGANLVLVARGRKNLESIAEELRPRTKVEIVAMDVSDAEACTNLFKKAEFEFGGVHVLVNNAGYHQRGPVQNVAIEDLGKMIDVNLKAPIVLSRLAIPYIKQSGGGAVINVGSLAGRTPVPGSATYSASKSGLRAFTKALAEELRGSEIKVAIVSPGPIDTGFIMSDIDNVSDLTFSQPISTAEEVADEIMKLCLNDKPERSMPPLSGFLTTLTYLFPGIGRAMRPVLESKGRRVKRKLKAQQRAAQQQAK
jgi:short-subunit dehydrogenase